MRRKLVVAGSLQITREERSEGPVIRVFVYGGIEALKFDCFARGAHYHLDPDGRNRVYPIVDPDPVGWTQQAIRGRLQHLLESAGYPEAAAELPQSAVSVLVL